MFNKIWWAWFLGACITAVSLTGCAVNINPVRERPVYYYRAYGPPVIVYPRPYYLYR